MTKEERASMRSIWERWHEEGKILSPECFKCTGRNTRDVLRLLDVIDEMETQWKNIAAERNQYKQVFDEVVADRDYWKARTQAMERAIKSREANETLMCTACYICVHVKEDTVYCAENCGRERKNWEFNQERFKG